MTTVIRAQNLGKKYVIAHNRGSARYKTLRDTMVDTARRLVRPSQWRQPKEAFWALRDVEFDIAEGERVGIIGRNGAGKSTLLKILSRITEPSTGEVALKGRVASLLEVNTGFHPELTGRENIFLKGVIHGMTRADVRRKFDDIVAFSGIEKFLDTPVKRYSSGMYVRLSFAVAAHLEPDILIVDEVLAVGDAAFQKKCLGKMGEVAREGRTVLFVSHNMMAIESLCNRAMLVDAGRLVGDGATDEIVMQYQSSMRTGIDGFGRSDFETVERYGSGRARFRSLTLTPLASDGGETAVLRVGGDLRLDIEIAAAEAVIHANVAVVIYDSSGYRVIDANTAMQNEFLSMAAGETGRVRFNLRDLLLKPGTYYAGLWVGRSNDEDMDGITHAVEFNILPEGGEGGTSVVYPGIYQVRFDHEFIREDRRTERTEAIV